MSQRICPAEPKDGQRILEILECSPAKGSIELLYTRRPDAYLSYQKESDETYVYVVKEDDDIVGTAAEIVRRVYIGGEARKIGYLCGLKKDIRYGGYVNLGSSLLAHLAKEDADGYLCSVISDNEKVYRAFEKKRKHSANMTLLQGYTTYMLAPYFHFPMKDRSYTFHKARPQDEQAILIFLNTEGRKKEAFPVFERIDQFTDLRLEDFYVLKSGEQIVAVGALWNQSGYRQYIVKKYRGLWKAARLLNPVLPLFGYIKLPRENEHIRFPMLSFFISRDDDEEAYKAFLNHINPIIRKSYGMFVIGTTESYFAHRIYRELRSIHFDTRIYAVEFPQSHAPQPEIDKERLWLECGLL